MSVANNYLPDGPLSYGWGSRKNATSLVVGRVTLKVLLAAPILFVDDVQKELEESVSQSDKTKFVAGNWPGQSHETI